MLTFIGTWFGYVGMCMVAPDATCRPFLAFLALGVAACVGLTLAIMAYKAAQARAMMETEEERGRTRAIQLRMRTDKKIAGRNAGHRRWRVAV